MKIAILSGKGGTGKTTVSTNLAGVLKMGYVDLDVEEPNGFLFLKPEIRERIKVETQYPVIDQNKCTVCGKCVKSCQFNALAKVKNEIVVFEKLCHYCGACELACELGAVGFTSREIGVVEKGKKENIDCYRGILNIGEPMAVPVIRKVLQELAEGSYLLDCPPGTSCNVVNSLQNVDGAILVTEPSKFGLHDLEMAIELTKQKNIPYGVICNKDDGKENLIRQYCKENYIKFLGGIPYSKEAAILYAEGKMLSDDSTYRDALDKIANQIREVFGW